MEYGVLSVILVIVVAFLAGLEGILDQWQFHQPIIACSLIGIVTGHASAGIILGGSLQLIALGCVLEQVRYGRRRRNVE